MVHLVKKRIKGNTYLYLEERIWINGKSKRLWQKYLGSENKVKDLVLVRSPDKLRYKIFDFGGPLAIYDAAKYIGLVDIINKYTDKEREQGLTPGELFVLAVINRCIEPVSKDQIKNWFKHTVLTGYFKINPKILNSQTYWNHFRYFSDEIIEKIEEELNRVILSKYCTRNLFLHYDPTNFYTYIKEHKEDQIPRKGHSKDKRFDLNIVNLSLFCLNDYGLPLMHTTYNGNTQDAAHFKVVIPKFITRMKNLGYKIDDIIIVFDKGNHSKESFDYITDASLKFIASVRPSSYKYLLDIPLKEYTSKKTKYNGKKIKYLKTSINFYGINYLGFVIFDLHKYKKACRVFWMNLEETLNQLKLFIDNKLNIKKWRDKEKTEVKIRKIIGKKFGKIIEYQISGNDSDLKIKIFINRNKRKKYKNKFGKSILITNLENWSDIDVINSYYHQYVIENVFKYLKCHDFLSIRPVYHWTDRSIKIHVFICVIGYLLLSLINMTLINSGIELSYKKFINELKRIKLIQISTPKSDKSFNKLGEFGKIGMKVFEKLKLNRYFVD